VLVDVALRGDGVDPSTQAPRRLPAVFAGAPLVVRVRWRGRPRPGDTIELRGRLPAGTEYVERLRIDSARPGAALEQSWARAHIRDLEDQYAAGDGNRSSVERAIVAVSLRHRVLSRFTAFVAVDRAIVNPDGNPQTITQPVEPPAGWGEGADPGLAALSGPAPGQGAAAPMRPGRSVFFGMPAPAGRSRPAPAAPPPAPAASASDPFAGSFGGLDSLSSGAADDSFAGQAPPAPPVVSRMRVAKGKSEKARDEGAATPTIDAAPYVARLHALADELARAAAAPVPGSAAQLPVARLGELLEDLRTVGLDELARKLAPIVDRLRGALAGGDLVAVLHEVAASLHKLPAGDDEPPPPRKRRGWAFWR
jgi:Ca-activated chloride channel family protein